MIRHLRTLAARILLLVLEWLAISAAAIAAAAAVESGPPWAMPAACLCAVIGAQLRVLAGRRALERHMAAVQDFLRDDAAGRRRIVGGR